MSHRAGPLNELSGQAGYNDAKRFALFLLITNFPVL
jgi:hypothetical protein